MRSILLMSGGIDSALLLYTIRPDFALFIDYGQVAAEGERQASRSLCDLAQTNLIERTCQIKSYRSKVMSGQGRETQDEYWPFRNQFLISIAAMEAVKRSADVIIIGIASGDAHFADGSIDFVRIASTLVATQHPQITVKAPLLEECNNSALLLHAVPPYFLRRTHSCNRSAQPCWDCPSCVRAAKILGQLI